MDIIEIEPETLNIDSFQIPEFKINDSDVEEIISKKPSANFGGGIELLMNGKKLSFHIQINQFYKVDKLSLLLMN